MAAPIEPMPLPHSRKAPRFSTTPYGFDNFFSDLEALIARAQIATDKAKIEWALRYAEEEGDPWNYVPCMITAKATGTNATWNVFKDEVRLCYPHLTSDRRYTVHDLEALIRRTSDLRDMTREDLGDYYRRFLTYSAYLLANRRITESFRNNAYLRGFPDDLREEIAGRLKIKKVDVVPDDGYDFEDIQEAANFVFSAGGVKKPVVKAEPGNAPMSELVQAMSNLTRIFTASLQNQQHQPPAQLPAPPRYPPQPPALPRYPQQPPPLPAPGAVFQQQNPSRWPQPNPDQYPQNCIFCSAPDHYMRNCPVATQYLQQGKVIRNAYGKLTLPDGSFPPRSIPGKNMRERVDNWYGAQGIQQELPQEPVSTNYLEGLDECVFSIDVTPQPQTSNLACDATGSFDQVQTLQAQIDSLREAQVLAIRQEGKKQFDGVEIMRRVGPPKRQPPPPPPVRNQPMQPIPANPAPPAPEVTGKPGARPDARPQGPMRPVTFPTKPAAVSDDQKFRYQAPVETNVKTSTLADRALDAQITISARELLAASSEVRRHVKDSVTNKKVSANLVGVDPLDTFLTTCFDPEPAPDAPTAAAYLDLIKYESSPASAAATLPLRVIYPSFGNGVEPECILDGGAQIVVMRRDVWERLRAPFAINKAIPMESANSGTHMTLGLLENHPVSLGPITIYLQIQVVENAPFEVLLGRPFFDVTSCQEISRPGGSHQIFLKDPENGNPYVFPTFPRPPRARPEGPPSGPAVNFHQ